MGSKMSLIKPSLHGKVKRTRSYDNTYKKKMEK